MLPEGWSVLFFCFNSFSEVIIVPQYTMKIVLFGIV